MQFLKDGVQTVVILGRSACFLGINSIMGSLKYLAPENFLVEVGTVPRTYRFGVLYSTTRSFCSPTGRR